jgi:pimeloyl-ACP methyl ester carboxylesterase
MTATIRHALAPFVAMLRRPGMRRSNAKALTARAADGADRGEWFELGGTPQWVTLRSARLGTPILLVVHGGPASPYIPFNPQLASWESDFTVVQWDQRGAGRTFIRNGPDPDLSIERIAADGVELARRLRLEYPDAPVVLMGSSVGTVIARRMADTAPQLFDWFVGANQVGIHSRAASWQEARTALMEQGKRKALDRLDQFGPDPRSWTPAQAEEVSKHAIAASPQVPDMVYDLMLPALMYTPDYSMADIREIGRSMEIARDALYAQLAVPDVTGTLSMPVLLVHGEGDLVNPVSSVRALIPLLTAPQVELIVVPNVGHLVEFADVDGFAQLLRAHVLPGLRQRSSGDVPRADPTSQE